MDVIPKWLVFIRAAQLKLHGATSSRMSTTHLIISSLADRKLTDTASNPIRNGTQHELISQCKNQRTAWRCQIICNRRWQLPQRCQVTCIQVAPSIKRQGKEQSDVASSRSSQPCRICRHSQRLSKRARQREASQQRECAKIKQKRKTQDSYGREARRFRRSEQWQGRWR